MELIEYTAETSYIRRVRNSYRINFSRAGSIRMSYALCTALGIELGSKIVIAQDKAEPTDWYLMLRDDGLTVHRSQNQKRNKYQNYFISSKKIADELLDSLGATEMKSASFTVSMEHVLDKKKNKLYPIITARHIQQQD